ncbi:CD1871A family CXXC motif-containing protein [Anaerococcus vaginalis]|uniref:CD1871A family CXXC motif-containing protein n=1 Tax=Anaerococcus vaginalis TaxID=33037 RepID=UPI0036F468F6
MIDIEIKKKKNIQIGFLILSIGFISYGAFRGEVDTVFSKAIKLCLECVGIG